MKDNAIDTERTNRKPWKYYAVRHYSVQMKFLRESFFTVSFNCLTISHPKKN